jgi:parallel beta-helix repeat protein
MGGILVENGSYANVSNNIVSNNSGGIHLVDIDSGFVKNNQVIANSVDENAYFLSVLGGSITIDGNLVSDNHATGYGAGIGISGDSDATVVNNIIVGNTGQEDKGGGTVGPFRC